jgi:hypothetical protein
MHLAVKAIATLLLGGSFAFASPHLQQFAQVDTRLAESVPVVLRVRRISEGEGSKYLWPQVELVTVIKNGSRHTFPKHFEVAHYSWEPGIPPGTSTLYLERYNPHRNDLWRLLGGSATTGVSHNARP